MEADGTKARTVASSPYFHWRQRVPPDESGAAAAALRELAETLEHDGWKPAGRGEEWFAVRFERELVLDGVGSMTDDESTVIRRSEAMAIRADQARVILLCERLVDATAAGATEWSGEGDDHFRWERAEGTVSIGARDRDGQPPYELVVFSGNGERVEELASALVDDDRPAEWNEPLAELYRVARRSALHADEIIAALMQSLPPSASEEPTAAAPAAERPE
jgi:hypothetical protein